MRTTVATLILGAVLVVGCGGDDGGGGGGSGGVNWGDPIYGDSVQTFIDQDAAANDCGSLQQTFGFWADNRPGDRAHPELLGYIDDKLEQAGCYD